MGYGIWDLGVGGNLRKDATCMKPGESPASVFRGAMLIVTPYTRRVSPRLFESRTRRGWNVGSNLSSKRGRLRGRVRAFVI